MHAKGNVADSVANEEQSGRHRQSPSKYNIKQNKNLRPHFAAHKKYLLPSTTRWCRKMMADLRFGKYENCLRSTFMAFLRHFSIESVSVILRVSNLESGIFASLTFLCCLTIFFRRVQHYRINYHSLYVPHIINI